MYTDGTPLTAEQVEYPDVVAVDLRKLPSGTKQALWRALQLQSRAYNWGVEHALGLHNAGEKIPSPRVDSGHLTLLRRHPENRKGGLRLQRGGFYQGVNAAKKWSKHRRSLTRGFAISVERVEITAKRLAETENSLPSDARDVLARLVETASEYASASSALVSELEGHPDLSHASDTVNAEPVESICEKFHARSEALVEEHKTLVPEARQQVTAHARNGACPKEVKALRSAVTKNANAVKKHDRSIKPVERHLVKGVKRLFRSRKDTERASGPALVFHDRCRIADGELVLPCGISLRLPRDRDGKPFAVPARMKWGGAVHVVDATDEAGRVTRRTKPRHRKYRVHFLCKSYADAPTEPTDRSQTLGVDWGIRNPLVCSDGTSYPKYASSQQEDQSRKRHHRSKQLQKSMSQKQEGSRRYRKQKRQRNKLIVKNTAVKVNQQFHNAKHVATKPGVRSVAAEDTKAKNMTKSATGSKAFPARSAGKRGLNRVLAETAPARMLRFLARAMVKHSVGYVPVYPAYTSLTCFVCGKKGTRETQARFVCSCGNRAHADLQASLNINARGHPNLYPPTGGGRDSRRKILDDAMGIFERSLASTEVSRTNTPVNPGI